MAFCRIGSGMQQRETVMKASVRLLSLALAGGIMLSSLPAMAEVFFRTEDRAVLHSYVTTVPAAESTVTFFSPGSVLPDTVTYTELPATVTTKLVAPPEGKKIAYIGRNVYLIDPERRMVVD